MNIAATLKADAYRLYGRTSWALVFRAVVSRRTFGAIFTLRLCQAASAAGNPLRGMLPILKFLHRVSTARAAMDLPWKTKIGSGFAINHGWGMVVSPGARIGSNVTLFHGVTLGRRDRMSRNGSRQIGYPVVEDEVWIGPHAIIVGDVVIGRGSRIAGGAFVTESVPPYSTVSGNPALILKRNGIPDVMNKSTS